MDDLSDYIEQERKKKLRPQVLREGEPQVRKHIWIFKSDEEEIKLLFGSTIGESKAIRMMIRKCLQQIKAKASQGSGAKAVARADLDAIISKELSDD